MKKCMDIENVGSV